MSGKNQIEARLDRSLRKQITVPRLDGRFDAAVWARIEAADATSRAPVIDDPGRARAARLIFLCNLIGAGVAVALTAWFVVQWLAGAPDVSLSVPVNLPVVSVPTLSEEETNRYVAIAGSVFSAAVIVFGLSFTSFGHRIRASFG
jgi:hypothetical protein